MMNDLLNYDYESNTKKIKANLFLRVTVIILTAAFLIALLPLISASGIGNGLFSANAASPKATAKATATVQLRKSPSTSAISLGRVKKNSKVTITSEVFKSQSSTAKSTRWYKVKAGKKSGYIKANRVKNIKYSTLQATTTDDLNYRKGAGTKMKKKGTAASGTSVTVQLPAKAAGSDVTWYRVKVGKTTAYMSGDYLVFDCLIKTPTGKKGLAGALYKKLTNGGKMRIVATFDEKNCSKRFAVSGVNGDVVPQGLAYTGSLYYVLFGMDDGQSIVTYSKNGKVLNAVKVPFKKGHPNGFTWNPKTKRCYIFRGYQYKCDSWNPATGKVKYSKIPYSSSGVSYDRKTKKTYVSSKSGIRVYSSDGKFRHERVFNRCSRNERSYVQDCGAYGGFIFHGVSGSNKRTRNFIDVYRALDGKYMGTIQVNLGEIESLVVNKNGYLEILINHAGTFTEYIWQTPLNVKDLM